MFKPDIEKAFDSVNWECLFKILSGLEFLEKWKSWVKGSMCSSMISVLVNGEANGYFRASKGLRQGDPLSPGLFVLVMDVLSMMLKVVREAGKFKGFYMNEDSKNGEVTHLLFADDTVIFCDANHDQVLNILATIVCFQSMTGLRINLDKSVMYIVGDVADPSFYAAIFGCKWSRQPPKYLGFPLGAKLNDPAIWDSMINKMKSKLNGWGSRHLSYGARLVLCTAVLGSMPTYMFSLFKAPVSVLQELERSQRRFLWNGGRDSNRRALVDWKLCKTEKSRGGLGIHDLKAFNDAMLSK
ncbi:unnamed protein product [Linum trigynum]|uniref:Reverse transcriptase domain-containing protein n=1 Tax=Linum trigynum TaxID=586398 RepID=A0AAV2G1J6_9ROSI